MINKKISHLILGILAGLVAYTIVGKLGLYLLKISWADYAIHSIDKSYSTEMLLSRMAVALVASITASIISARIGNRKAAWLVGVIVFAVGAYIHLLTITWTEYPLWYHLSFLLPIIPLTGLSHYLFRKGK